MNDVNIPLKLWHRLPGVAKLLVRFCGPEVVGLIEWLAEQFRPQDGESLDIHEWIDDFWYVTVKTNRVRDYPDNILIGFTVDLRRDCIFWVGDKIEGSGFTHGGNCFVRSERWSRLLRKRFPGVTYSRDGREGQVYDYRPRRGE